MFCIAHGYSYSHIRKLMWDIYGLYLIDMNENIYKASRYSPIHLYKLVDENNNVVLEFVTLKALADFLKQQGDY